MAEEIKDPADVGELMAGMQAEPEAPSVPVAEPAPAEEVDGADAPFVSKYNFMITLKDNTGTTLLRVPIEPGDIINEIDSAVLLQVAICNAVAKFHAMMDRKNIIIVGGSVN